MPYLAEKNLLFIHIPKNAGRSIEAALGVAPRKALEHGANRSRINRIFTGLQRWTAPKEGKDRLFGSLDQTLCSQHLTLCEIDQLELLPPEILCSCKKFAICRNPYSRAISSFCHFNETRGLKKSEIRQKFKSFWLSWPQTQSPDHNVVAHKKTQASFVTASSAATTHLSILRFENLSGDFAKYCGENKINLANPLDKQRIGVVTEGKKLEDFYDKESKQLIAMRFAEDFETFNYPR